MQQKVLHNCMLVEWGKPVCRIDQNPDGGRSRRGEIEPVYEKAR
jgi:hypothetical protein